MNAPEKRSAIDARFEAVANSRTFRHIIERFRLNEKTVFDAGCSYGEHLTHFGPGSTGITISPEEMAEGVRRGLDMRLGNVETQLPVTVTYDVVYCSNLLEHLHSPHQFLFTLRQVLQKDGTLILGVPVIPFPSALLRIRKFRGALASNHINFFTADTLRLTVERAGWRVLTIRGFHFKHPALDRLVSPFYPHLYVIAKPKTDFTYPEKRQRELKGYPV